MRLLLSLTLILLSLSLNARIEEKSNLIDFQERDDLDLKSIIRLYKLYKLSLNNNKKQDALFLISQRDKNAFKILVLRELIEEGQIASKNLMRELDNISPKTVDEANDKITLKLSFIHKNRESFNEFESYLKLLDYKIDIKHLYILYKIYEDHSLKEAAKIKNFILKTYPKSIYAELLGV